MSFISVEFGYKQSKLFNINCQVAPLLDAISSQAYIEMGKAIKKREEWFTKEIQTMKKKEQKLLKKLDALDNPKVDDKKAAADEATASTRELAKAGGSKGSLRGGRKMNAKEKAAEEERLRKEEEERKRKEEEEARLKAEEEERKRKEEEEKKAKEKKGGKGGKKKEEEVEEIQEETEEQKLEREKAEINQAIDEVRGQIKAYEEKVRLCQVEQVKKTEEADVEKVIELTERTGERKFAKKYLD